MIIEFPEDFFDKVRNGDTKVIDVCGIPFRRITYCKDCAFFGKIIYSHLKKDGTPDKRYKSLIVSDEGKCTRTGIYVPDTWYCAGAEPIIKVGENKENGGSKG